MAKEKSKEFCIFRIEKLQTHGRGAKTLSQSLRHLDKHEQAADISHPELSCENRSIVKNPWSFKKIAAKLDKAREFYNSEIDKFNATRTEEEKPKRHMQKRASQAFEGILTFSPDMAEKVDIDNWVRANMKFLEKEFIAKGCMPLRLELHMDEETPHIHFVFATIGRDLLFMAKDVLGSRGDLSKLQDRYAESMSKFELKRGHSRYNDYLALCPRAKKCGFGNRDGSITYEQVKAYCEKYGEKIPKFRKHQSIREWKAQIDAEYSIKQDELRTAEQNLADIKQMVKEHGSFIEDKYLDLIEKCNTYESLLKLAGRVTIEREGEYITLLKYLTDLQESLRENHHVLDGPEH